MSQSRNLALAFLAHRSGGLVIVNSICNTFVVLLCMVSLIWCIARSPINFSRHSYRSCTVFEVELSYKTPIRSYPCSKNRSWPLQLPSGNATFHRSNIRLPTMWSTLHFPGTTFPTRMAGWHYVPIANVTSIKCLMHCKTVRPTFRGYKFKPNSALPFL